MSMANIAEGNVEKPASTAAGNVGLNALINMHETHHCILPMSLSWSMPKLPISRIENWWESYFLKMIFFLFVNL